MTAIGCFGICGMWCSLQSRCADDGVSAGYISTMRVISRQINSAT
jgi:hypothetical protein